MSRQKADKAAGKAMAAPAQPKAATPAPRAMTDAQAVVHHRREGVAAIQCGGMTKGVRAVIAETGGRVTTSSPATPAGISSSRRSAPNSNATTMHANQDFLAEMAERFVALDFTAANVELAEIQAGRANIAKATERAQSRRTEIAPERRDFQPDGGEIADALLDGASTATAMRSIEQLSAESDGLAAALRELGNRDRALIERQHEVRLSCPRQAAAEAVPLVDALESDLRDARRTLADPRRAHPRSSRAGRATQADRDG